MGALSDSEIVAELFGENDVRHAFRSTPRKLVVLTTAELIDDMNAQLAKAQLTDKVETRVWSASQDALAEEAIDSYVVFAPSQEEEILAALGEASPKLHGFYRDFYPRAACFGWARPAPKGSERIDFGYAILSTARSGSTLLSELMALNGLGRPKEHVRHPLATSLTGPHAQARFARFLEVASRYATYDHVLGTKIISHFADGVVDAVDASGVLAFLRELPDFRLVLIMRQNKVAQGLSGWRARQSKTFHIRSADDLQNYKSAPPVYNYAEIAERYEWTVAEEDRFLESIASFTRALGGAAPPLAVCVYEELESQLAAETARLLEFLGRPNPTPDVNVRIQKLADDFSEQLAERFIAEYAERNGAPPVVAYDFRAKLRDVGLTVG